MNNDARIFILIKIGTSQQVIADMVSVNQPTISSELKRNTGLRGYRENQAQTDSSTRCQKAERSIKMMPDMITFIG